MVLKRIIRRVEHSKWATLLVVVPKPGGKIWICGDYKVTVYPQLDISQYPLPKLDDLFLMLHDGKKFSKVDLSDACHVVDEKGIRPSPSKLKPMLNMPEPRNIKELNSYLGMIQYYGKFIPRLATLAAPLNSLRRKGAPWRWGCRRKRSFHKDP
ncbi:unnamed protein product [Haemonchus placei]|uniref:RNA-directed DNA polymerase n=1 Tax=Haemonchus placei TaxID=6290 RepID=A0A0N4X0E0_HAEPC|nr:unnamed protein product [Haemonchus placei]